MTLAAWFLGAHCLRTTVTEKKNLSAAALFFIVPWMLISMFFGLGPPPATTAGWVKTATEQQVRYSFLIIAGVAVTFGFAILRERLKNTGGNFYSLIGIIAILIAIPLFIINMTFWGSFLTEAFKLFEVSATEKRPEWYLPVREQFRNISTVEVALTYLATAAFAFSLKSAGWFRKTPSYFYIAISLLGAVLVVLPDTSSELLTISGFFMSIPAIPFLMPYFIGINLLRRAGN
jgi:hypothetical protein